MRSSLAVLTIAAGVVIPTGVASASTVSVDPMSGAAVFQSALASDVTTQVVGSSVQFKVTGQTVTLGAGCVSGPPVSCSATDQDIRFGSKNDRFGGFSFYNIKVSGGGGADSIRTAGQNNVVGAGSGDDNVWSNANGSDQVTGDAGNDEIYTFEGSAQLDGGTGNDLVVTHSSRLNNQLSGGDGNDELVVSSGGAGTLSGDAGSDVIVLNTPFGGFTADGGAGADIIAGSTGADTALGGAGNDYIDVSGDGAGDTVDCGSGTDTVVYDAGDTIAKNCEHRVIGPVAVLPQVTNANADADAFVAAMPAIPAF